MQCIQTLTDHTSVVMSLLCWEQFLLSCSLDQTIKVAYINIMLLLSPFTGIRLFSCSHICFLFQVWAATESGNLEVTFTHKEEHVGYAVPLVYFSLNFSMWFHVSVDLNGHSILVYLVMQDSLGESMNNVGALL